MQQELELEARVALIAHIDHRLQAVLGQGNAVHEPKVQRPRLARVFRNARRVQPEVKLDRVGVERVFR